MCSRFALTVSFEIVLKVFECQEGEAFPPRYNIAPTQPIHLIRQGHKLAREISLARWGFIPGWARDPGSFSTLINARSETVLEKPSFKHAIKYRRCLVPASCFYEWTGRKGARRAYMISPDSKNGVLAFAGIWEHWMDADGSEMETVAILTTNANTPVSFVHHRMPVIIAKEHYDIWLDVNNITAAEAVALCQPAPDALLSVSEISTQVNNYRNTSPDIQKPLMQDKGQQDLF